MLWTVERNKVLMKRLANGSSKQELAEEFGCSLRVINAKVATIGKHYERDKKIIELAKAGLGYQRIARQLGLRASQVSHVMRRLGLQKSATNPWDDQEKESELKRLHAKGFYVKQIARCINVSPRAVRNRLKRLGLTPHSAPRVTIWTTREDELRQLAAQGLAPTEITQTLGMSIGSVAGKLNRLGLSNKRPRKPPTPKPNRRAKTPPVHVRWECDTDPTYRVHILDATNGQCRWPEEDSLWCCGRPTLPDQSYCEHHYHKSIK